MLSQNRKQDILEKLAVKKARTVVPDRDLKPEKKHDTVYGQISSGWDKAKANPKKLVRHSTSQTAIIEGGRRRQVSKEKLRAEAGGLSSVEQGTGVIQAHLKRTGLIPRIPGGR